MWIVCKVRTQDPENFHEEVKSLATAWWIRFWIKESCTGLNLTGNILIQTILDAKSILTSHRTGRRMREFLWQVCLKPIWRQHLSCRIYVLLMAASVTIPIQHCGRQTFHRNGHRLVNDRCDSKIEIVAEAFLYRSYYYLTGDRNSIVFQIPDPFPGHNVLCLVMKVPSKDSS